MAATVCDLFGGAYPELLKDVRSTSNVLTIEEDRFLKTTGIGLRKLDETLVRRVLDKKEKDEMAATGSVRSSTPRLSGRDAFYLYDTFGLPRDFIEDATRDRNVIVDWPEFDKAMDEQRSRARASWKGAHKEAAKPVYMQFASAFRTEPDFYFSTKTRDCRIEAIVKAGTSISQVEVGEEAEIVLDRTVIYAESGGQVADTGAFYDNSESQLLAEVTGAFYPVAGLVAHKVGA